MSATTNWESLAIQAADESTTQIPHLNAWRLAKRFRLEGTAKHVLNVGLSNYDKEYRHRGWEIRSFAESLAEWMSRNDLLSAKVDRQALENAICDFLGGLSP